MKKHQYHTFQQCGHKYECVVTRSITIKNLKIAHSFTIKEYFISNVSCIMKYKFHKPNIFEKSHPHSAKMVLYVYNKMTYCQRLFFIQMNIQST